MNVLRLINGLSMAVKVIRLLVPLRESYYSMSRGLHLPAQL